MTKFLVYCHPSVPSIGIKINTWYSLEELQLKYSLEHIKCFFHPANFGWEEIEPEVKPIVKTSK